MRRGVRAALAFGVVLMLVGQALPASRASAATSWAIDSWIEISGTTPAAGCPIDASVQLTRDGVGLAGVEVLMALYVGEELISADRVATDEAGTAFLEIDGSGADGAGAWIDITLNGEYWWGTAAAPGTGASCYDGYLLEGETGSIPGFAVADDETAAESVADEDSGSVSGGGSFVPEVGFYVQQHNLSCEYASVYIATAAWDAGVDEHTLEEVVGWSDNPHWGFRGNIDGWWGNTVDYGVYAEPIAAALGQFGFAGDVIYGQGDASQLTAQLDAGNPVIVWLGLWGDQTFVEYAADGTPYTLTAGYHVGVAYGYDDGGVYFSDPAIGGSRYYDWDTFMYYWNVLDGMAVGVHPA